MRVVGLVSSLRLIVMGFHRPFRWQFRVGMGVADIGKEDLV